MHDLHPYFTSQVYSFSPQNPLYFSSTRVKRLQTRYVSRCNFHNYESLEVFLENTSCKEASIFSTSDSCRNRTKYIACVTFKHTFNFATLKFSINCRGHKGNFTKERKTI